MKKGYIVEPEHGWNEEKRRSNIEKHHLDFIDTPLIIDGCHILGKGTTVQGEIREIATGQIENCYATVVFTRRGARIRIISLRSARRGEVGKYEEVFGK